MQTMEHGLSRVPGTGGRDLLASGFEPRPKLAESLLALAGQLLQLHQLLLDVVQVAREIAAELGHALTGDGERVQDALLDLNDLG